MTNEIALYCMKAYSEYYSEVCEECPIYGETGTDHCFEDALEMAIKALETIPKYKDAYNKGWDDGAKATYEHLKMCEEEQGGDLISRDAVIDIIHRFFTEEVDKIPTKKTEDGEVYVIHKCQPLFEMNKAICKRIKALPSVSPTQNCVGNALDMRCEDAISRQKVLDVINLNWEYRRNCIRAIEKLPPVKQEQKWIPVSERLPEDGQDVLFCDIDNDIMVGYHVKGRPDTHFSQDGTYENMKDVRAWMPLPKPYEPQESEE